MTFVDGENFTIRGQERMSALGVALTPGRFWEADSYLWCPGQAARDPLTRWALYRELESKAIRSYYYTSTPGGSEAQVRLETLIHRAGFDALVGHRRKGGRSKAVDISLSVDMLSHAHLDHYDTAVLFAGDGDYVPLVTTVKRLGKLVWVASFDEATAPELVRAADYFTDMSDWLKRAWVATDPVKIGYPPDLAPS